MDLINSKPIFEDFNVDISLHKKTRAKLISKFKEIKAEGVIFLEGGKTKTRYDCDTEILFRQESNFHYLFGVSEADVYGAIDISSGKSFLFFPRLPESYATWLGTIYPLDHYHKKYLVDEVYYVEDTLSVLTKLAPKTLYTYPISPISVEGIHIFTVDSKTLKNELSESRLIKLPEEIEIMRHTNKISCFAHKEVMRKCKPGISEHELEALFLYLTYKHGKCRHLSYTCICAGGKNSATLHYPVNDKIIQDGTICLFDMGAEYYCYTSDITCSFPANGKFTEDQKIIYNIVRDAQNAVMAAMKPGVDWTDMHRLAERVTAEGLIKNGFLVGDLNEILKAHVQAIFFPHGLGHFLGLDTHDTGGYPEGTTKIDEPGIRYLRARRVLEPGMVITVEPGLYFIDSEIENAYKKPEIAKFLNKDKIEKFRNFGGVRLEHDVVVTATGIEDLTLIPTEVEKVEAIMAGKD